MKPYSRLQLLSGGGARFGYYLGSYAALSENEFAPHAILGSCGGSLAAWLIAQAPDPKALYSLATSAVLHETLTSFFHSNPPPHRFAPLFQAALRHFRTRHAHRLHQWHANDTPDHLLNELRELAAFRSPKNPSNCLNAVAHFAQNLPQSPQYVAPDLFINASRFVPNQETVLFQQIVFAQHDFSVFRLPENPIAPFAPQRQIAEIALVRTNHFQAAVAASLADMYYHAPVFIDDLGYCLGGVMNLQPVEIALALADTVFAESKPRYDTLLAEPAILRVFGTPANRRQTQVDELMAKSANVHILPFADNRHALKGKYADKSYNWLSGCLKLHTATSDIFAENMHAQWQYGYQKTLDYLNQACLKTEK